MDVEKLKSSVIEICKEKHASDILKKVDGKHDYKEISEILKIHPTTVSHILNKAFTFGLLTKEGNVFFKTVALKHLNIDRTIKEANIDISEIKRVTVRKRKKIINYDQVKHSIEKYFISHFKIINHPYSDNNLILNNRDLINASKVLYDNLSETSSERLSGLQDRFYDAFSTYFSSDRINKSEVINHFSVLVGCFEPYLKKVAVIKTGDSNYANQSISKSLINVVINFESNINNSKDNYWTDKPIHEACLRFIYPYRHIEAHEARDYTVYQMEKIIYYMFASIIQVNLNMDKQ